MARASTIAGPREPGLPRIIRSRHRCDSDAAGHRDRDLRTGDTRSLRARGAAAPLRLTWPKSPDGEETSRRRAVRQLDQIGVGRYACRGNLSRNLLSLRTRNIYPPFVTHCWQVS